MIQTKTHSEIAEETRGILEGKRKKLDAVYREKKWTCKECGDQLLCGNIWSPGWCQTCGHARHLILNAMR